MIVKVGNEYLELEELIEVEKKVKLFEDISAVEGDFSYSFNIPKTKPNVAIIQIYSVNDTSKRWSRKIPAEILNDAGHSLYSGFIRIENDIPLRYYQASFFSGNTNWIDELNFSLLDLDYSEFDKDNSEIEGTFTATSGTVFPIVDNGTLKYTVNGQTVIRRSPMFSLDELVGYVYVKSLATKLLTVMGMKMTGDILTDPIYNSIITSAGKNKLAQGEIDKRKVYAGKSSSQYIPTGGYYKVFFTATSAPYYNSDLSNWDNALSRYTFDIDTKEFDIEVYMPLGTETNGTVFLRIVRNGVDVMFEGSAFPIKRIRDTFNNVTDFGNSTAAAGDYYEIQLSISGGRSVLAGSYIKVIPKKFFKTFGKTMIPDMTASTFLSNVFRMLNMIVSYNDKDKTFTVNKLDSVIASNPIDISEYITISEHNFEEFVSDYYKNNLMIWQDQSSDEVENYNDQNKYPYGSGNLTIDNDFLEDSSEFLEMDFAASWHSLYDFLGMDMPRTDFLSASVKETRDLQSVSNDSDLAEFNISGSGPINAVVRIYESTVESYNGSYHMVSGGTTFNGMVPYDGNATGKVDILIINSNNSDPVFLINHPSQIVGNVSSVEELYAINLSPSTVAAFANFIPTDNFIAGLNFDYLKGIYFNNTQKLLNNGIKSYGSGNIPEAIYQRLDFMSTVKVGDTVYYVNKISGYKGSKYPVTLELIKK